MKRTEILAYAAGIIDGEGCIAIVRRKPNLTTMEVHVVNTNEWLIQWFHMQFGGAVVHNISKNPKHKDRWSWHIPSKQASEFLKLVLPYLQLKRPQAELAIKYQSGKKNWGPIKTGYRSGTHKPNESYVLEEAQKLLMNRYNKKGPI